MRTHCGKGHQLDDLNTYRSPGSDYRQCRNCRAATARRYKAEHADRFNVGFDLSHLDLGSLNEQSVPLDIVNKIRRRGYVRVAA